MDKKITTIILVRSAVLGAVGAVIHQFGLRLPIFPGFMSLDIGNLPALIGAITTGPLTGFLVVFLTNVLDALVFGTNSGGIGNLANFVMGAALVVPVGFIYKRRKNVLGYAIGGVTGILCTAIVAAFVNYFVLLPLFSRIFMPMETILSMANAVNPRVTTVPQLIIFAIIPFNLLKGTMVVVFGFIMYRTLSPVLKLLEKT